MSASPASAVLWKPHSNLFSLPRDQKIRQPVQIEDDEDIDTLVVERNAPSSSSSIGITNSSFFLALPSPLRAAQKEQDSKDINKEKEEAEKQTTPLATRPAMPNERALMSMQNLLMLLRSIKNEEEYCSEVPEDDSFSVYGSLAEEEEALHSRYLDRKERERKKMQFTKRREAAETVEERANQEEHDAIADDDEDDEEEDDNVFDDDDDVIIVGANGTLSHDKYNSDQKEIERVRALFESLTTRASGTVFESFGSHLDTVLTREKQDQKQDIISLFQLYMTAPIQLNHVQSVETVVLQHLPVHPSLPELLDILKALEYALCSESESERVISAVRNICGDKKTNTELHTLNHKLIAKYYGSQPSVPY